MQRRQQGSHWRQQHVALCDQEWRLCRGIRHIGDEREAHPKDDLDDEPGQGEMDVHCAQLLPADLSQLPLPSLWTAYAALP